MSANIPRMEDVLAAAVREAAAEARMRTDTDRELALFQLRVQTWRDRRPRRLAAAAAIVAIVFGLSYLLVAVRTDDAPPADQKMVTTPRPLRGEEISQRIELPGAQSPTAAQLIGGSIWTTSETGLTRIGADNGEVQATVSIPDTALNGPITVTPQGWWLGGTRAGQDGYLRIDPETQKEIAFAPVGSSYASTYGQAGLWVVSGRPDTIARLDPKSGTVEREMRLPERPYGLLATERVVWAQAAIGGALYRVDPATNTVTRAADLNGSGPFALVGDELWVAEPATRALVRLDAQTGSRRGRIRLPGPDLAGWEPGRPVPMLAVSAATIYVIEDTAPGLLITRINPGTGRVVASVRTADERSPGFPALDAGGLWLPLRAEGQLLRLAPLTR